MGNKSFEFTEQELNLIKSALKKDMFDYDIKELQHKKYDDDDRAYKSCYMVKQALKTLLKKLEDN